MSRDQAMKLISYSIGAFGWPIGAGELRPK